MRVEINADDYGLTKGVTDGIIKAHREGCVTSTTLMMNGLSVEYAVEQAKSNPALKVGIHLVLTWGRPISNDVASLVQSNGKFRYTSSYREMDPPSLADVEREWRAQIEEFKKTGLTLNHIDSHHHVHAWPPLTDVIIKLAKEFEVPVRYADTLKEYPEICWTERIWVQFYQDGVNDNLFEQLKEEKVRSLEIMTHPGFVDEDLKENSSYLFTREKEVDVLCRIQIPEWVE
ncbi:chitin disaccharide deacetylase [Oceanobacillus iheyensis]|uniref:chitin disaccharide deacetylase n=1 Tax=Oceanobacillus iheyensis TaxID=182710 RepID=UPI00362F7E84